MTGPAQKESERRTRTLDAVMNALGLRPDHEPEEGEAPDFIMRIAGRVTGLEVAAYRSGDAVEDGTPRRAAEAEWEKLQRSAEIKDSVLARAVPDLSPFVFSRVKRLRDHVIVGAGFAAAIGAKAFGFGVLFRFMGAILRDEQGDAKPPRH